MTETIKSSRPYPSELNEHIRGWNDILCLWRLCRRNTCFKSRACHGADARRCFDAHFSLLPDNLIAWMHELAEAQREGLSYDQAIERMRGTNAENALEDWHEAIAYSEKILRAKKLEWALPESL